MHVHIRIGIDNAAFEEAGTGNELATILHKLADKLEGAERNEYDLTTALYDSNGNHVGNMQLEGA